MLRNQGLLTVTAALLPAGPLTAPSTCAVATTQGHVILAGQFAAKQDQLAAQSHTRIQFTPELAADATPCTLLNNAVETSSGFPGFAGGMSGR